MIRRRSADRALALLDGFGIRTLIGDRAMPLSRARQAVRSSLADDLGLSNRLLTTPDAGGEPQGETIVSSAGP